MREAYKKTDSKNGHCSKCPLGETSPCIKIKCPVSVCPNIRITMIISFNDNLSKKIKKNFVATSYKNRF